jgi:hypothetical protein
MRIILGFNVVITFLFLVTFIFLPHNILASEVFAPITNETWECGPNNEVNDILTINVDNININSVGKYDGVLLNNDGGNAYSLSGRYRGPDHKFYSIILVPNKPINYFKGSDELVIGGKAIVHYDEYSDCFGESHGQVFYNCRVTLER